MTRYDNRRLLVEDIISLRVGQKIWILVSRQHDGFEVNWKPKFEAQRRCLDLGFQPTRAFGGETFYELKAEVVLNAHASNNERKERNVFSMKSFLIFSTKLGYNR
jgi:hypothetical protein